MLNKPIKIDGDISLFNLSKSVEIMNILSQPSDLSNKLTPLDISPEMEMKAKEILAATDSQPIDTTIFRNEALANISALRNKSPKNTNIKLK